MSAAGGGPDRHDASADVANRFTGATYRAANWTHVGRTTGRGKLDRHHHRAVPVKDIYLRPLHRNWWRILTDPA